MLFLDGVYVTTGERLTFRRVPPPTVAALETLVRGISERVGHTRTPRPAGAGLGGHLSNAGFSLHAGVASEAHERDKLERLCRYITRPAVSTERLSVTAQGNIRTA
jgi:hypothetical protein